jgi:hypothetical protein
MTAASRLVFILFILGAGQAQAQNLPWDASSEFLGSGACAQCHASDGAANAENGVDISPPTLWRSTMMANSAKDPLWRAKVSAEVDRFPQLQGVIETTCTRCHAPMGNEQARHDGQDSYSIAEMVNDPLALDGVSCTLCHQVEPGNLGTPQSYSGGYQLDATHQIYGPFTAPLSGPMVQHTGFTPVYGAHVTESELCATCHTLFTAHVDNDGNVGGSFPEQTPYLEWKNSYFPESGVQCQSCHMPPAEGAVDISTMPPWHTTRRAPYARHEFVGANELMLNILKDNATELGVTATAAQFDSTLARTRRMLETQTVSLSAEPTLLADTLAVDVTVENLAGHKLPTGIPLRRMWVHLKVTRPDGEAVFESGAWDEGGEIIGLDATYEPHHDVITSGDQIQIYEPVMGDVDEAVTYTLLRASHYLKDNRIPPMGFTTAHSAYDSTGIFGAAVDDADFNHYGALEGTGADRIHYRIPVTGEGPFQVEVEVLYQTLKPRAAADLLSHDTAEVAVFAGMYEAADRSPALIAAVSLDVGAASPVDNGGLPAPLRLNQNVPNPFNPATVISFEVESERPVRLDIYDVSGQLVRRLVDETLGAGPHAVTWDGKDQSGTAMASGVYFYKLQSGQVQDTRRMTLLR